MSDLISRNEVLELLYKIFDEYYMSTDKNPSIISKSFGTDSFGIDVFKKIKKMPTAYSVNNVIEELELHSFELGTDTLPVHYIRLNEAVEIVKQGGVSDDTDAMCEWKVFDNSLTNEPHWVYETDCGKYVEEEHTSKAFVYCPYCGKKLNEMECD